MSGKSTPGGITTARPKCGDRRPIRSGSRQSSGVIAPQGEWIAVARIPAVVSQEQFEQAREKLARNQSFARRNNKVNQYLLRAMVSCGRCRLACQARKLHPDNRYYICTGKARNIQRRREEICESRFIPAGQLEELVWKDLCQLLTHPEIITQALESAHGGNWLPQELQARRENLRKGQNGLQNQIDRLTEAYLSGVIPLVEYERRRGELEQSRQALEEQEQRLKDQAASHAEVAGLATSAEEFCRRVEVGLATATFEQKQQLMELLIDRVVVTDDDVEIRYVIPTSPRSEHVRFMHLRTDYFNRFDLLELVPQLPEFLFEGRRAERMFPTVEQALTDAERLGDTRHRLPLAQQLQACCLSASSYLRRGLTVLIGVAFFIGSFPIVEATFVSVKP